MFPVETFFKLYLAEAGYGKLVQLWLYISSPKSIAKGFIPSPFRRFTRKMISFQVEVLECRAVVSEVNQKPPRITQMWCFRSSWDRALASVSGVSVTVTVTVTLWQCDCRCDCQCNCRCDCQCDCRCDCQCNCRCDCQCNCRCDYDCQCRVRSSWDRALASLSVIAVTAAVTGTAVRTHLARPGAGTHSSTAAQLSCDCHWPKAAYCVVTAEDGRASSQAGSQAQEY